MVNLLDEVKSEISNLSFRFYYDLKKIDNANIIFTEMVAGEFFLCHDILNKKHNETTVFIFHTQKDNFSKSSLPNCINNAIFIHKQDSIINMRNKILKNIKLSNIADIFESTSFKLQRCLNCQFKTVTSFQLKVLYATSMGLDTTGISEELDMNYKTVFSHKRNIMSKFNITNKHELHKFAILLRSKK